MVGRGATEGEAQTMKFAYADPPYLGCCGLYDHHHPDGKCWDDEYTHRDLLHRLSRDVNMGRIDGWAVSLHVPALPLYLSVVPSIDRSARVGAWVKPFASFKPGVNPAYAWEPVIWTGGRKRTREVDTVRDWVSCPITLQRGLTGAKPDAFCFWLFDLLGMEPGDEFVDLFPGTGGVSRAWDKWCRQGRLFVAEGT